MTVVIVVAIVGIYIIVIFFPGQFCFPVIIHQSHVTSFICPGLRNILIDDAFLAVLSSALLIKSVIEEHDYRCLVVSVLHILEDDDRIIIE